MDLFEIHDIMAGHDIGMLDPELDVIIRPGTIQLRIFLLTTKTKYREKESFYWNRMYNIKEFVNTNVLNRYIIEAFFKEALDKYKLYDCGEL